MPHPSPAPPQLMFDEWVEFCGGARTSAKLHVFVQWRVAGGSDLPEEQGETPRSQAAEAESPRSQHEGQREEEGQGGQFGHRRRQQLGGGSSDDSSSGAWHACWVPCCHTLGNARGGC